uniref:Uncharacterized protein n=1 Tax=Oryza glumipatula TaxID=40148 RepID=A0A0E0BIU0_9ORYZ
MGRHNKLPVPRPGRLKFGGRHELGRGGIWSVQMDGDDGGSCSSRQIDDNIGGSAGTAMVVKKRMTREVWDCLKKRFIGTDQVRNMRLQTLKSNITSMRMANIQTLVHTKRLTAMLVC